MYDGVVILGAIEVSVAMIEPKKQLVRECDRKLDVLGNLTVFFLTSELRLPSPT